MAQVTAVLSDLIFESRVRAVSEALGVSIVFCRTAAAAVEYAGSSGGLILDLNLEPDDGIAVCRTVRAAHSSLPIVAYLSHVQKELAEQALTAGASLVIPRSRFVAQLPALLQSLAAGALPSQSSA